MEKKYLSRAILFAVLLFIPVMIMTGAAYADSELTAVGTLSATFDSQQGKVTAMFVGYCEGQPVIIGPATWTSTSQEFSAAAIEKICDKLLGSDQSLKKVTRTTASDKGIIAEIVIKKPSESIMVGR
ncbi:MAG: hypothetical protein AB1390_07090 [Nitrospirota bacterium]